MTSATGVDKTKFLQNETLTHRAIALHPVPSRKHSISHCSPPPGRNLQQHRQWGAAKYGAKGRV
ncbi:hypothetical protein [Thermoleptolyngbya sp.]